MDAAIFSSGLQRLLNRLDHQEHHRHRHAERHRQEHGEHHRAVHVILRHPQPGEAEADDLRRHRHHDGGGQHVYPVRDPLVDDKRHHPPARQREGDGVGDGEAAVDEPAEEGAHAQHHLVAAQVGGDDGAHVHEPRHLRRERREVDEHNLQEKRRRRQHQHRDHRPHAIRVPLLDRDVHQEQKGHQETRLQEP